MKSLRDYILEKQEDDLRSNIKFTIWKAPDKKVNWIKDNEAYQKIEYKHIDKKKKMSVSFLLGFDDTKKTWQLYAGKIGAVTYDDDPIYDLETDKFADAIVNGLDKIEEYIKKIEEEPDNWIQYYKDV